MCVWIVDSGRKIKESDFYWGANSIRKRLITEFAASKPFQGIRNSCSKHYKTKSLNFICPTYDSLILSAIDCVNSSDEVHYYNITGRVMRSAKNHKNGLFLKNAVPASLYRSRQQGKLTFSERSIGQNSSS